MYILRPMFMRSCLFASVAAVVAACTHPAPPSPIDNKHPLLAAMAGYCGQAFEGEIVSKDPQDDDWRSERIIMHVRDCEADELRLPLHVGDNRSRTWILTDIRSSDTDDELLLKHQHLHEDGSADAVTNYGGRSSGMDDFRYNFPADQETKVLFDAEDIPVSKANVWVIEYNDTAESFAYELNRPNRFFRIEFDLTAPVEVPPPAWGYSTE